MKRTPSTNRVKRGVARSDSTSSPPKPSLSSSPHAQGQPLVTADLVDFSLSASVFVSWCSDGASPTTASASRQAAGEVVNACLTVAVGCIESFASCSATESRMLVHLWWKRRWENELKSRPSTKSVHHKILIKMICDYESDKHFIGLAIITTMYTPGKILFQSGEILVGMPKVLT